MGFFLSRAMLWVLLFGFFPLRLAGYGTSLVLGYATMRYAILLLGFSFSSCSLVSARGGAWVWFQILVLFLEGALCSWLSPLMTSLFGFGFGLG